MSKQMNVAMILMAAADNKSGGAPPKSKSENWNKAVGAATGEPDDNSTAPDTAVLVGGMEAMFSKASQDDINKLVNTPGLEFAPVVRSLEEGDRIDGILVGYGPQTEFTDKETKKVRIVNTWIVSNKARTFSVSILSATQLERKCPPFVGGEVTIIRGKDLKTQNGYRVTDYMVCGPTLQSGPRVFATLPSASQQPALGAGSNVIDADSTQPANASA